MSREELVTHLWEKASEKLFASREDFERSLEGWDIQVIELEGEPVGSVMRRGPEFHFTSLETGKILTRQLLRDLLRPQLEEFGYMTTKTPKTDDRQHRFNKIVGFKKVGEDEFDIHYRLDSGNRRETCPSQL